MFGNLFRRWHRDEPQPQTARSGPATDASASSPAEPPVQPWRLVRRRPLIGRSGAIAGWDLQLPAATAERIARPDTPKSVRDVHQLALLHAARCVVATERTVMLAPPAAALVDATFLGELPSQTILRLGAEHETIFGRHLASVVDSLVRRHLQVATASAVPGAAGLLDGDRFADRESLLAAAQALAASASTRVAINLLSFEDLCAVLGSGFSYCCGAFQRPAQRPQRSQLSAPVAAAAGALAALVAGKPTQQLAARFKSDPTLSYRLLRTINSAAFGLSRPVESIHDALILLGTRELYRWLTAVLVASETDRPLAPALSETALTRARLCELIALERGSEPPEALFVVGAFSLLDVLLDVPLEVPLASAGLSENAVEALIGASGPWRPHLDAAIAFENADDAAIEHSAGALGLAAERLAELAEAASTWGQAAALAACDVPGSDRKVRRAA